MSFDDLNNGMFDLEPPVDNYWTLVANAETVNKEERKKSLAEFMGEGYSEPMLFRLDEDSLLNDDGTVELRGTTQKGCYMLKGKHLLELYDAVKNDSDCQYVSCANDFIKNSTREEFAEHLVYVFVRDVRFNKKSFAISELIYSRLANVFGMKSAFSVPITDNYQTLASVDLTSVVPDGQGEITPAEDRLQKLEKFNKLVGKTMDPWSNIGEWIEALKIATERSREKWELSQDHIDQLIYKLIKAYIIRIFIFRDSDFHGENVLFLYSGDYSDLEIIDGFDLEYCGPNKKGVYESLAEDFEGRRSSDIDFLQQYYPEHLKVVMQELNLIAQTNAHKIFSVFEKFAPTSEYAFTEFGILMQNIQDLNAVVEMVNNDQPSM